MSSQVFAPGKKGSCRFASPAAHALPGAPAQQCRYKFVAGSREEAEEARWAPHRLLRIIPRHAGLLPPFLHRPGSGRRCTENRPGASRKVARQQNATEPQKVSIGWVRMEKLPAPAVKEEGPGQVREP